METQINTTEAALKVMTKLADMARASAKADKWPAGFAYADGVMAIAREFGLEEQGYELISLKNA